MNFVLSLACPHGFVEATTIGWCYQVFKSPMTYSEAVEKCEKLNSKLAEPKDLPQSKFIYDSTKSVAWIGVNDITQENE